MAAKPFHKNDLLPGAIRGISRTSLWDAWKAIRKDLKHASVRDVVDFLDYDVNPDIWINRLLHRIKSGDYQPETPSRFTLAKSKGFSRTMTMPSIPDLVLYRAIVDYIFRRSRGQRHPHVYFLRDALSKAQRSASAEGKEAIDASSDIDGIDGEYRFTGKRSFLNWLRFDQYRKHLIYEKAHEFIVITDVANFFDTVLHSHVEAAVRGLNLPPRLVGLLHFLLEHLSNRQDFSSSHGISLPTDEFDCSRTLAHMVLFPHDAAMVRLVGESGYVRWMDDQNMAVGSKAEGVKVLSEVGRSLARLHLTPNSQKSSVLSLSEARRHFHLDLNRRLDEIENLVREVDFGPAKKTSAQVRVGLTWKAARRHEGKGEFSKILKRIYRLAGLTGFADLRERAVDDALTHPTLVPRIAAYFRCTGTTASYLDFCEELLSHPEQVYPDVNVAIVESLLRVEPNRADIPRLRRLTRELVRGDLSLPGDDVTAATASLLVLRFGDKRLQNLLRRNFSDLKGPRATSVARSAAIVYGSYGSDTFREVRETAETLLRNHLSSLVRLMNEVRRYEEVPQRYRSRFRLSFDSVAGHKFVDTRVLLAARLLLLNEHKRVRDWVLQWRDNAMSDDISNYDRRLLRRLIKP